MFQFFTQITDFHAFVLVNDGDGEDIDWDGDFNETWYVMSLKKKKNRDSKMNKKDRKE